MTKELAAVPQMLRERIIQEGEISPDGAVLRLKPLNRVVDVHLISRMADYMADWVKREVPVLKLEADKARVMVVESSGNMLAGSLGERLALSVVVVKKGRPGTMFGPVLTEEIHSFTRQQPTTIAVERRDIAGMNLVGVDDFAASGDTLEAVEKMAKRAGGELIAILVGIAKPSQGSGEIMSRIRSLAVVEIESMRAGTAAEPARIKFRDLPEQSLVRRWGDG